jgi:hypothetical protein
MSEDVKRNYRLERIERLLDELKYEVTRGMMEGELPDETMHFRFMVPISKAIRDGMVICEFRTRPVTREHGMFAGLEPMGPKLKIVKGDDNV